MAHALELDEVAGVAWVVMRRGFAPLASAIQMSPRYENVMRPSLAT